MKQTNKKLPKWLKNNAEIAILLLGWAIVVGATLVIADKTANNAEKQESVKHSIVNRNALYNDTINQRVR